jgi:hypothetical protein
VDALRSGKGRVPYRDSKLTRFLQDSLGGTSFGLVIANVAPTQRAAPETMRTLSFASKSREIVNSVAQHQTSLLSSAPVRQPLRLVGVVGAAVRPSLASTSFLQEDVMRKLAQKAAQKQQPNKQQPISSSSLMTPVTHDRAVQQIHDRAVQLELSGEMNKALAIYQGALSLVGEDDRFILARIDLLKEKIAAVSVQKVQTFINNIVSLMRASKGKYESEFVCCSRASAAFCQGQEASAR